MFRAEARWINAELDSADIGNILTVLDVGASDFNYRTVVQPHIHELIHKPLLDKGCKISFLDIKDNAGVDIVADLTSIELSDALFSKTFDLILCCNLLEHVTQRDVFIRNLLRFSHHGTLLVATVPCAYPQHADPIDTMYRPSVKQLIHFIESHAKCNVIKGKELVIDDKEYYVLKPTRKLDYLLLRPVSRLLRWYIRPYRWKVSCSLLEIQELGSCKNDPCSSAICQEVAV